MNGNALPTSVAINDISTSSSRQLPTKQSTKSFYKIPNDETMTSAYFTRDAARSKLAQSIDAKQPVYYEVTKTIGSLRSISESIARDSKSRQTTIVE